MPELRADCSRTMCLVPFVSFVVMVGSTIATGSREDLGLLSKVVSIIKSAVEHTPATQKLYNVCQKFHQIAESTAIADPARAVESVGQSNIESPERPLSYDRPRLGCYCGWFGPFNRGSGCRCDGGLRGAVHVEWTVVRPILYVHVSD